MNKISSTFRFSHTASHPKNAIAFCYDLEGFSRFFNVPEIQEFVPGFLNHISKAIEICIFGGKPFWTSHEKEDYHSLEIVPVHEKFLGDGGLYIFLPPKGQTNFNSSHLTFFLNRLWNVRLRFHEIINSALEFTPTAELPKKVRFGLARGGVWELQRPQKRQAEYIGFCINLASRLQKYCPQLGFIASARLQVPASTLTEHRYKKVIATGIPGFARELVIVDENEFNELPEDMRSSLFETI